MTQAARGGVEFCDEIVERGGTGGAFASELLDGVGTEVGDDELMSAAHEAARHVRAHAAQAYHCELHSFLLNSGVFSCEPLTSSDCYLQRRDSKLRCSMSTSRCTSCSATLHSF